MPTVNDITTLNIDEVAYDVSSLSEEVQGLVEIYNNWNRKENDARGELAILQAAKQTLSAQIVNKVKEETAAAATNVTEPPAEEAAAEVPAAEEAAE